MDRLLTVKEAAILLRISQSKLYCMIKENTVPHSARCENLEVFAISETKTKSSRRLLCLPAYVADALRKRRELLEERRRELGAKYNEQDLVCFRETGVPFTSNALRHQYLKALE